MEDCCAVCAEPLEWVAFGPCRHKDVCSLCVARLRVVLKDTRCCICKQDCPSVYITKAVGDYTKSVANFEELPKLVGQSKGGDPLAGGLVYYEDIQGYFDDKDHFSTIRSMCKLSCSRCEKADYSRGAGIPKGAVKPGFVFRDIGQLKWHLDKVHKLTTCDLCLQGRKVFVVEQKLYTRSQLEQHLSKGNSEVDGTAEERGGFKGHPLCSFCNKRFYGEHELYQHMTQEHFTCHICQRQNPGQYQYYATYADLESHFGHDHFLCEDPSCLEKKFVVFTSESDLKRHNAQAHGGNMSRSQRNAALTIPVSFYYSRPVPEGHGEGGGRGFGRGAGGGRNRGREIVIRPEEPSLLGESSSSAVASSSSSGPQGSSFPISREGSLDGPNDDRLQLEDFPGLGPSGSSSIDSQRWLSAASGLASNSALQEAAFPPLPGTSKKARQKAKQRAQAQAARPMSTLFGGARGSSGSGGIRVLHTSQASRNQPPSLEPTTSLESPDPSPPPSAPHPPNRVPTNGGPAMGPSHPNTPIAPASGRTTAEALRGSTWGTPSVGRPSTTATPSASGFAAAAALETARPVSVAAPVVVPEIGTMEDIRAASKALIQRVREALGGDEGQLNVLKDLMGRFRKGEVGGAEYCKEVSAMKLGWIIPELARLCPDPEKKKELLAAHQAAGSAKDKEPRGSSSVRGSGSSTAGNGSVGSSAGRSSAAVNGASPAGVQSAGEAARVGDSAMKKKGKSPAHADSPTPSREATSGKNELGKRNKKASSITGSSSGGSSSDLVDDLGEDESRDKYRGERGKRPANGKVASVQGGSELTVLTSGVAPPVEDARLSSSTSSPSLTALGGGSTRGSGLAGSSSSPDLAGSLQEGDAGDEGWECRMCTLRNKESAVRCDACGSLAPSGGSGGSTAKGKKKGNKQVTVRLTSGDGTGIDWGLVGQPSEMPTRPAAHNPPPLNAFGRGRGFGRGAGPNAWGGRGGQRIVAIAERESIIDSIWARR